MNKGTPTQISRKSSSAPPVRNLVHQSWVSTNKAPSHCADQSCPLELSSLQRKVNVGIENDPLEREADCMADRVMRVNSTVVGWSPATMRNASQSGSRMRYPNSLQRSAEKSVSEGAHYLGVGSALRSSGLALDTSTRQFMESGFGQDFSSVRIHTNSVAAASAKNLNAQAYTLGQEIVFAQGKYQPGSYAGRRLLAHELTHTLQQRKSISSSGSTLPVLPDSSTTIRRAPAATDPECTAANIGTTKSDKLSTAIGTAGSRAIEAKSVVTGLNTSLTEDSAMGKAYVRLFGPLGQSEKSAIGTVRTNIEKIASALETANTEIFCPADDVEALAGARPDKTIRFYKPFFSLKPEERVITVLHEFAHIVIGTGPDVYVHQRVFDDLNVFTNRPGKNNPDSLAIFISVLTRDSVTLNQQLKQAGQGPKRDRLTGFKYAGEEEFVNRVIGISELVVGTARKKVVELREAMDGAQNLTSDKRVTLFELRNGGFFSSVDSELLAKGSREDLRKAGVHGPVRQVNTALGTITDRFKGRISVKRNNEAPLAFEPGLENRGKKKSGLNVEVTPAFFLSKHLARSGTESELPVITVKKWLRHVGDTANVNRGLGANTDLFFQYLDQFTERTIKQL